MRDYVPTLTEPVKRWLRFAAILVGSLLLLWLAVYLKEVLTPVVAAMAAAYILNPVVKLLEQRKIKRVHTIAGIYVVAALAIGVAVYLLGETAFEQITRLWGWLSQPDNIIRALLPTATAPTDDGSGLSLLIDFAREQGSAIAKGALAWISAIYANLMFWITAAHFKCVQSLHRPLSGLSSAAHGVVMTSKNKDFLLFRGTRSNRRRPEDRSV